MPPTILDVNRVLQVLLAMMFLFFNPPIQSSPLAPGSLDRYVYPLERAQSCPRIKIDYSELPDQKLWLEKAEAIVRDWYPEVTRLLATRHFHRPRTIRLVMKKSLDAPAATGNETIEFDGR